MRRLLLVLLVLPCGVLKSADEPNGLSLEHAVLSVDGGDLVRIKYCGLPLQVRLANVQIKAGELEKQSAAHLKSMLRPGTSVRIELEPERPADGCAAPEVQLFVGQTHLNLELVKRGLALSDARSKKYSAALQAAQSEAMTRKSGVWASAAPSADFASPHKAPPASHIPVRKALPETAPAGYSSEVVADLNSKEYHYPGSRYAQNIRAGARIEYKSPEEAERAGKTPSPFSFPERAQALADKLAATTASSPQKIVEHARKAMAEALSHMQEARKASKNNTALANENWKKAGKLLTTHLDRLTPIADANPHDQNIQKLTEEMSMNLYSCNKYQSL